MNANLKNFFPLCTIAAAVFTTLGPVVAAEEVDEVTELSKPESSVSVGIGYVSDDNQRFGQYTGLNEDGAYGLLDLDYIRRDEATGTWLKLNGRNLGFDNRELRLEHEHQGDWGYFIDYSQIPRFDPFTVNTGLQGLGTTTQTTVPIAAGAGTDYHLDTERDRVTLGFKKYLPAKFDFNVRYRHEEKDGNRLFGQGTFGNWRFLTDVIDQTTQQIDATLNYTTENLQLTGGYYGTSFDNHNNKIDTPGAGAPFTEAALPPDNQSHQIYLAGGYNFSKSTRGTFKFAYGRITQDETYPTTPVAGVPNSLDGQIDTILVQLGLTARPIPKLSLRADLHYEDRDDKTPVFQYFPAQATPTSTTDGTNEPRDIRTSTGKFEADYRLPAGFRLKGGLGYEEKKRNSPPVRSVDFRETTEETTYFVELRRSVSPTVTGAVSLLHSKRDGSEWFPMVANNGTDTSALIAPLHLIDRDRDTARLTLNWVASDSLSLNFRVDESRDDFSGRNLTGFDLGAREGRGGNYSVDAAYLFSDEVTGTAWYSRNENEFENALCRDNNPPNSCEATDALPVWGAELSNIADSFGLGLRVKTTEKLDIGADLTASRVRDDMKLNSISPTNSSVVTPLPDIETKVTTLKLYGKYALNRHSGVRVDYIYDRYETDDWTWANWVYTDGTTVLQEPDQKVNFVGVSYYYRWR
jgi:MtrB/PioB family decaheme-associated outer membrane protein